MDKLPAPPNGSPEEIQAWNNMMDTMVTFIKASTHLMNTITQKVRSGGASTIAGCEPECEVCQPKPPCGICGKAKPTTPPAAESSVPPAAETPAADAPPDPPPENTPPEDITNAEVADTPAETSTSPAPDATDEPSTPASQPTSPGEKKCNCSAIRAEKLAAEKKDRCNCSRKTQNLSNTTDDQPPKTPEVEVICGCGATPGNAEAMMRDMMEKLASAQEEINQLQEELAKLQRMDASKKTGPHGGPNPAALYREIMKDTGGGRGRPICVPCDEDPSRGYMRPPDMSAQSRPVMHPPSLSQFTAGRSPPYYASPQPPCRRPGQRSTGPFPIYGRSPQDYDDSANPEYWSRMGEYGPSPNSQVQRQMIVCPSMRTSTPAETASPKRTIVCTPPRQMGPGNCDPNSCRIRDPNQI